MFDPKLADVRRFFCETWRKHRESLPLEPIEALALDWILAHPEYHADLADLDTALAADYSPHAGKTNPVLHLSLHLAISEQASIDQPPTIHHGRSKPAIIATTPSGSSGSHSPYQRKNLSSSATWHTSPWARARCQL